MRQIFAKKDKRSLTEIERDNAVLLLQTLTPRTDAYNEQLEVCIKLHDMVIKEKEMTKTLSPDAVLNVVGGCLVPVGLILNKEQFGNFTSKATNFILKGRVR